MSVELEWELYDIFDSGTFAFPIYDHNSARKIVRYLLMRGILHEEIAEAIEESTGDLLMWLNRHGKHKVGEWVIAWVNDCREDFDKGELHKMGGEGGSDFDAEFFLGDNASYSDVSQRDDDDGGGGGGGGGGGRGDVERRSDSRVTELESISSEAATSRGSAETLDGCKRPGQSQQLRHELANESDIYQPAGQPRTPPTTTKAGRPNDLDLTACSASSETSYEAPDSGHFSDLYLTIPSEAFSEPATGGAGGHVSTHCAAKLLATLDGYNKGRPEGADSPKCTCSVAHYSYGRKKVGADLDDVISDLPRLERAERSLYDICFGDALFGAVRLKLGADDGPGFVYIMTDSIVDCLPWSSEHRYKIASATEPDGRLLDFRARHLDVDLIWQVKVRYHLRAVREIHALLVGYNLHSNWFKCSLSLIMDTVSKVVKHYK